MGNPTVKARNLYLYQNITNNQRTPVACVADGSGIDTITNRVRYWNASGVPTSIFVPAAGATSPRMALSRDYAFFTDGITTDFKKWNLATSLSNWGIAAPTDPLRPAASSGTSAVWSANTVFSTMGIIIDGAGNVQQLASVNADDSNVNGVVGTSSAGQPSWNNSPGGTTSDGTETWKNNGPVGLWRASTVYNNQNVVNGSGGGTIANPAIIYDPVTSAMYMQTRAGDLAGTSGTIRPTFPAAVGGFVFDGTCKWFYMGGTALVPQWKPSTFYPKSGNTAPQTSSAVLEPGTIAVSYDPITDSFLQKVWVQYAGTTGTSAASHTAPAFETTAQHYTTDGQLSWLCLGSATWANGVAVTGWGGPATINFTVKKDAANNIQVCTKSGTTGGSTPTWGTTYGAPATDGTATWVCVGPSLSWAALTKYFLPTNGFVPPESLASFGGATIVDTNNVFQTVIASGKSGVTVPVWQAVGVNTTDNAITWFGLAPVPVNSGGVTVKIGRKYFVVYLNFTSQTMSDLSPESVLTGPITNGQVFLSVIPISPDPQVDQKIILATGDGGDPTILYFLAQISNATTTYSDDTPEEILVLNNIYQEQDSFGNDIGVLGNQPPPNGSFPTSHQGRMYLAQGPFVYFSKSISELTTSSGIIAGRYEESFPFENIINIPTEAEKIRGLLSDGTSLYVGSERHIRRVYGDPVLNPGEPQVLFAEAGILTQNVWQIVFREGTPIGAMWVTPDFRVLRSDFNTYIDAGVVIQSTLNTINQAAINNSWAASISYGPYNFYVLGIPTGTNTDPNTLCVYDLHLNQWYVWNFVDKMLCGLFYVSLSGVPRWLMFSDEGTCRYVDPLVVVDRSGDGDATGITTTIRTTWLHLGDPTARKILNEIELLTTDTAMKVTVEGATTNAEFNSPHIVVSNASLVPSQFGELKVYLAGLPAIDRFYRFTFTSTSKVSSLISDVILGYSSVEAQLVHRI
jgi:hypothetical protein